MDNDFGQGDGHQTVNDTPRNDVVHADATAQGKLPDARSVKTTAHRLRKGKEKRLSHRASLDWRRDQVNVCEKNVTPADIVPVDELKALLEKSRTAQALFEDAAAAGLRIAYDTQMPGSQLYPAAGPESKDMVVTLNPYKPKGELACMLARELRRVWQYRHDALVNPLSFEPDEAILVNRAQHADAFMVSIKIAWELKLIGENETWDALVGSPVADVSRAFEIKAQADFRTINNGIAARAAYDKMFDDCKTKGLDKKIIHQMLLDETGYIRKREVKPRLSMDLFSKLGELPHGRNYLSMQSTHVPTDTCYSVVEDRSNANFLWFIKFERSFQEKEMEMMRKSVKATAEIIDFSIWSQQRRGDSAGL